VLTVISPICVTRGRTRISITRARRLKILDFGLAQVVTPAMSDETATLSGPNPAVMGTIGYMSPEQVRGETVEAASDIFSLGCVLYEMVTGRRAFIGKSSTDAMAAILRDEPAAIADSGKPSSPDLDRIIERCLAKIPAQRFHSARDLAFALRSLSSSSAAVHKPVASPARIGRRVSTAALGPVRHV
jgi:eukaryotic-like serine/threonine-protein kinase